MQSQILLTPTSPVLGDEDIGYVQRVAEEMSDRHERDRILKLNPFISCQRGPALRHSVAVFTDINAEESRMAAAINAVASTTVNQQRALKRVQSCTGDRGDDEVAK